MVLSKSQGPLTSRWPVPEYVLGCKCYESSSSLVTSDRVIIKLEWRLNWYLTRWSSTSTSPDVSVRSTWSLCQMPRKLITCLPVKKARWNSASKWLSQTGNCSLLALADKEHKRTVSNEIQAHKTKLKVCQRHKRSNETCVRLKSNFQNINKSNILLIAKCIKVSCRVPV